MTFLLPAAAASAAVTCPATVTTSPTGAVERLTGVVVWNAALREPIDSAAPPALVPGSTRQSGATLTATWHLTGDATERDYLACTTTAPHLLRFDITGLATCTETITLIPPPPQPSPPAPSPPPAAKPPS